MEAAVTAVISLLCFINAILLIHKHLFGDNVLETDVHRLPSYQKFVPSWLHCGKAVNLDLWLARKQKYP